MPDMTPSDYWSMLDQLKPHQGQDLGFDMPFILSQEDHITVFAAIRKGEPPWFWYKLANSDTLHRTIADDIFAFRQQVTAQPA